MNERIKKDIDLLPSKPGSYQMYNDQDEIIYIGKAKNLKKRVSQYFLRPQNGKTASMVSNVSYFKIIITNSEKEAFILERNLIAKYLPRYNILLKDDKHYPYIALHKVKDPYISISRNIKDRRCEYFGPFPLSKNAFEMVNLLNKLFKLRKCKNIPKSPCLYYHLGQCLGPCIHEIKKEEYDEVLNNIRNFLKGDNKDILNLLKAKMEEYAENMNYEDANEIKGFYDAILDINEAQHAQLFDRVDRDIFAYSIRDNYLSLSNFIYRKGILIGKKNFVYEVIGDIFEFVTGLIGQYYEFNTLPKEIVVGNIEIKESLESIIDTKVVAPTKGKLYELLNVVLQNSKEDLDEHFATARLEDDKLKLLDDLAKILNIKTPLRIELFDNSHLQGTNAIGAMVQFVNGEPNKRGYRKFNIQGDNKKDDLASMREVLTRRYGRLKSENQQFPDLIILDGGKTQLEVGLEVMKNLEINVEMVGLVKSDKHRTNGLVDKFGNEFYLDDNKPLFYFLTRMQDEVHRFAITSHIQKRSKTMYKSLFDDIEGLGPKRRELLEKKYLTIEQLKEATLEEFEQILPKQVAENLFNKLRENK